MASLVHGSNDNGPKDARSHDQMSMNERELRDSVIRASRDLPLSEKADLETALAQAPALVYEESDPLLYLKFYAGDVKEAAERLASFWKLRAWLYGERAFLPLAVLDGRTGALTPEEIEWLEVGSLVFLPDDSKGRTVLFFSNKTGTTSPITRFRCSFYMLWKAVLKRKPFTFIRHSDSSKWDQQRSQNFRRALNTVPLRLESYLCVYSIERGARRMFQDTVPLYEGFLAKQGFPKEIIQSFMSESTEELLHCLEGQGLDRTGLPPVVGGTWSDENFTAWIKQERQAPTSMVDQKPAAAAVGEGTCTVPDAGVPAPKRAKVRSSRRDASSSSVLGPLPSLQDTLKPEHEATMTSAIAAVSRNCLITGRPGDMMVDLRMLLLLQKSKRNAAPLSSTYPVLEPSRSSAASAHHIEQTVRDIRRDNAYLSMLRSVEEHNMSRSCHLSPSVMLIDSSTSRDLDRQLDSLLRQVGGNSASSECSESSTENPQSHAALFTQSSAQNFFPLDAELEGLLEEDQYDE